MIGLDTNVLIRYIVQDDEQQSLIATNFIENQCSAENPAFINEITLCEIVWVLKRAYHYDKTVILAVLKQLLGIDDVCISSHTEAWAAYSDYKTGTADFSDYFMARINKKFGCQFTFSFDKKACQNENFKLLTHK
ncbi:MAG: PIN domain-containing protein [Desulfococcaceae bacterium]